MLIKKSKLMRAYMEAGRDIKKTIEALTKEAMVNPDEFPGVMEAAIKEIIGKYAEQVMEDRPDLVGNLEALTEEVERRMKNDKDKDT
jgi:hypothetical protein